MRGAPLFAYSLLVSRSLSFPGGREGAGLRHARGGAGAFAAHRQAGSIGSAPNDSSSRGPGHTRLEPRRSRNSSTLPAKKIACGNFPRPPRPGEPPGGSHRSTKPLLYIRGTSEVLSPLRFMIVQLIILSIARARAAKNILPIEVIAMRLKSLDVEV